jgi:tetratricopeptide (TPR) repeat protein
VRLLAWLAVVVGVVGAQLCLGAVEDPSDPVRQGYLTVPPAPLGRAVAGFDAAAADFHYIRFANYWGYQLVHGRHFQNLAPLVELITDLDPRFKPCYELGALALGDAGQPDEAARLLDKGARQAPDDYWYPYQAGMILFFYSDDFVRAARYFEAAARKPNAPPEAGYMAGRMYQKSKRTDLAIRTWRRIYQEAKDRSIRQVAHNALIKLGIEVSD